MTSLQRIEDDEENRIPTQHLGAVHLHLRRDALRRRETPEGKVGLARYRKSSRYAKDGGWSVVCTRCGRVGERGSTQIDAKARWNAKRYKYGPLKEEDK